MTRKQLQNTEEVRFQRASEAPSAVSEREEDIKNKKFIPPFDVLNEWNNVL